VWHSLAVTSVIVETNWLAKLKAPNMGKKKGIVTLIDSSRPEAVLW
jgi:hypothetical protein